MALMATPKSWVVARLARDAVLDLHARARLAPPHKGRVFFALDFRVEPHHGTPSRNAITERPHRTPITERPSGAPSPGGSGPGTKRLLRR